MKKFRWTGAFVTLCLTWATAIQAQSLDRAQTLFAEGQFGEAAAMYRALTDGDPQSGPAWYGLARALHEDGTAAEATSAYERTLELGENPARTRYHFARLSASTGDDARAVKLLREAQEGGMSAYALLMQTAEFTDLHDEPSFQEVAEAMKPCTSAEYAHFDFWLGEWVVKTPAGQPAGTSRVTKIQGGCALLEEWSSAAGTTGTSFNTFNAQKSSWQQFWIDAQGSVLEIKGELVDEAMVLSSDPEVSPINRITWTPSPDGSVRQHWETSSDSGSTWSTAFDGIYRKKD